MFNLSDKRELQAQCFLEKGVSSCESCPRKPGGQAGVHVDTLVEKQVNAVSGREGGVGKDRISGSSCWDVSSKRGEGKCPLTGWIRSNATLRNLDVTLRTTW